MTNWNSTGYGISAQIASLTSNGGSTPNATFPSMILDRPGVHAQSYDNIVEFKLGRFENSSTDARTQLDIALTHGSGDVAGTNIMSLRSNGNVGIGTTMPVGALVVMNGNVGIGTWVPGGSLIVQSGNIGLGITSPNSTLDVGGEALFEQQKDMNSNRADFTGWEYGGIVVGGDTSGRYFGIALGGANRSAGAGIADFSFHSFNTNNILATTVGATIRALSEDSTSTNYGMHLGFMTRTGTSTLTEQMRITSTGNVGIGTSIPSGGLAVMNGNVGIGTWVPSARMQVAGQYNSIRYNNGSTGGSVTIDWNNGNVQAITLTSSITSLTLNNPVAGGRYLLEIKQGGSGSYTVAWPGAVKWPSSSAPTLTTVVGQSDIITVYYNGTNYAASSSLNYAL